MADTYENSVNSTQLTYEGLEQRRKRIDNETQGYGGPLGSCIRALLDDADCGAHGAWLDYARALAIAEKELGL